MIVGCVFLSIVGFARGAQARDQSSSPFLVGLSSELGGAFPEQPAARIAASLVDALGRALLWEDVASSDATCARDYNMLCPGGRFFCALPVVVVRVELVGLPLRGAAGLLGWIDVGDGSNCAVRRFQFQQCDES